METVFLLAGATRRARERPRSATRRSNRTKADRHAPTVSDHPHAGDKRDGDPTPQPISKAVNDKGPRDTRHAPPLARIRAKGRYEWVGLKDERCCVFRPRTTDRRVAEDRPNTVDDIQARRWKRTALGIVTRMGEDSLAGFVRSIEPGRLCRRANLSTKPEQTYRSFDNRPRGVMAVRLSGVRRVISMPSDDTAASTNSVFFRTPPSASTQVVLSPSSRAIEPS